MLKNGLPTIKDVAQSAGVSSSTAAQVLRKYPQARVAAETRKLVLNAAKQLGYQPNLIAQALRNGKTNNIGIINSVQTVEVTTKKNIEIQRLIHEAGYRCFSKITYATSETNRMVVNELISSSIEGVILAITVMPDTFEEMIKPFIDAGIPIAVLDNDPNDHRVSNAYVDRRYGGYIAVKHLIELGHSKIGIIHAEGNSLLALDRFQGYKQAHTEAGLAIDLELCSPRGGQNDAYDGYNRTKELIARRPDLTAIFCLNDLIALGAMKAANELGYNIPEDISIVGFDNSSIVDFGLVPLTSIEDPVAETAKAVVNLLLDKLNDNNEVKTVYIKPNLIIRKSTGVCNKR